MLGYKVIGRSFRDVDSGYEEDFYADQLDTFFMLFPGSADCVLRFSDGATEKTATHEVPDYVDRLSIKEGVDIVRFETGNIGFVAFDGSFENGFEIILE